MYVSRSIFGINPESLDTITRESVFQAICDRFTTLTVSDIQLAFRTHVQAEKVYILTRDEFIKPIFNYIRKKNIVENEVKQEILRIKQEIEVQKKIIENYQQAKQLYIDSIGKGNYLGDMFQASMIMENFTGLLTSDEKSEMMKRANEMYNEAVKKLDNEDENTPLFVPTGMGYYDNGKPKPKAHYYLSLIVINHFLNKQNGGSKGWKFVEK